MLSSAFVALFNHLLNRAEWARRRLLPFSGRPARLVLEAVSIDFTIEADGHVAASGGPAEPDVTISAPLAALPDLIDGWERVMKSVRINGNAEMADALGFVFRNLRWDPEADLAGVVGDVAARRLHRGALRLLTGQATAAKAIRDNLIEYLTIERNVLLERASLSQHASDLRALRDAVARLEKHVEGVEHRLKGAPAHS